MHTSVHIYTLYDIANKIVCTYMLVQQNNAKTSSTFSTLHVCILHYWYLASYFPVTNYVAIHTVIL